MDISIHKVHFNLSADPQTHFSKAFVFTEVASFESFCLCYTNCSTALICCCGKFCHCVTELDTGELLVDIPYRDSGATYHLL